MSNSIDLSPSAKFILQYIIDSKNFDSDSTNNIDWEYIRKFSIQNGIAPFLYNNTKQNIKVEFFPESIINTFRKDYYKTLVNNVKLANQLGVITTIFKSNNIQFILLKGLYLTEHIYGGLALRPMGDIDILIEKSKIEIAKNLLLKHGFVKAKIEKTKFIDSLNLHYNIAFYKDNLLFELHWNIISPHSLYDIPIELFWKNTISTTIENTTIDVLSLENNLIHLCLHLHHHLSVKEMRFNHYLDLYLFIKKNQSIDWKLFEQTVIQLKINIPIWEVIFILKSYFNLEIPIYFSLTNESVLRNNFIYFMHNSFDKIEVKKDLNYAKKINAVSGKINKIRYLFGNIFPSKDYFYYYSNTKSLVKYPRFFLRNISLLYKKVRFKD